MLAIFLLVGVLWGENLVLPGFDTPEKAGVYYNEKINGKMFRIEDYTTLENRPFGDDRLVFSKYTVQKEEDPQVLVTSFVWVKQGPFGWYIKSGDSIGVSPLPEMLLYNTFCTEKYRFIYGQSLSEDIVGIEVNLDNGLSYLDNIKKGSFGVVTDKSAKVIKIQIIDRNGGIIKTYTSPNSLSPASNNKMFC